MDAHQTPIEVTIEPHGRWTVATVKGELDLSTVDALHDAIDEDASHVAISAADIRFIDSTGLRGLLELRTRHTIALIDPSESVRKLLDLTHLDDVFTTVGDVSELPD